MSRPQKIMKPIKAASFNQILTAVAIGSTPASRRVAIKLAKAKQSKASNTPAKKP